MNELFSSPQYAEFPASLHLAMLKDSVRMEAYARSMKEVIRPGDIVIDVGAGTGVLALMAASMGASKVYGIEKSEIVDYAVAIKELNCPDAEVEYIKADIFDTDLLGIKADVVICELFGNFGIDENVIEILTHVRKNYLKPDGSILPESMNLVVAAVQCTDAFRDIANWRSTATSFDFSPMQELAYNAVYQIMDEPIKLLSNPVILEKINFLAIDRPPRSSSVQMKVKISGVVHGIAGWFSTTLSKNVRINCDPSSPSTHWGQVLFPIGEPRSVNAQTMINFEFSENSDPSSSVWHWNGSIISTGKSQGKQSFDYVASRDFN